MRRRDKFHQQAKSAGFRARAVFKLQEVDEAHPLFRKGDRVLDLGCAPGSWLQYASSRVGPTGRLVGIDRTEIGGVANARLMVGDVFTVTPEELRGELAAFDVVMSDMAPDTTGVRHLDQARSEGLFAGIAVNGSQLSVDKDAIARVYGGQLKAHDIVQKQPAPGSPGEELAAALKQLTGTQVAPEHNTGSTGSGK